MGSGILMNQVLSLLLKKVVVPGNYHDRVIAVNEMLNDDVSGLVDSLTDFAVNTACVDFAVETDNEAFTTILKKWLDTINSEYRGKIPSGLRPLAKEYFKERWKSSSFPVLKISEWGTIKGVTVPTKMFFVDGGSIYAKDKNEKDSELKIINYDYYLGANMKNKLANNCIFAKCYGRWFDKYPTPYLIKRGVYHNYKIIQSLKDKETTILEQIIPYMLLVKKGTEGLARDNVKSYTNDELKAVIKQFQDLMNNMKENKIGDKNVKAPIRVANFDEEISHIIPDLKTIFNKDLFVVAERNILSGLGFIDVVEATSSTRRESILNPKVFIEEVRTGVEDFKQFMKELILLVIEKNKGHKKYINSEFYITAPPIVVFQTDEFKNQMRLLWERGQISNQTYCEIVGETSYRTEVYRREKEAKKGEDYTMYPHIRENREGQGIDIPGEEPTDKDTDKDGKPIPTDKLDDKDKYDIGKYEAPAKCPNCGNIFDMLAETEAGMGWVECPKCGEAVTQKDLIESKIKYNCECLKCGKKVKTSKHCNEIKCPSCGGKMRRVGRPGKGRPDLSPNAKGDLEIAPYTKITELPPAVKKKLSPAKQKSWMKIFNNAYSFYMKKYKDAKKAESLAFRTAWSQIKQVKSKKNIKKK